MRDSICIMGADFKIKEVREGGGKSLIWVIGPCKGLLLQLFLVKEALQVPSLEVSKSARLKENISDKRIEFQVACWKNIPKDQYICEPF